MSHIIIGRINHLRFQKRLEDDVAHMKANMTPEELAKYEAEQRASEKIASIGCAIIGFVSFVITVAFAIWVFFL
jgi:hypothetical protein